MNLGKINVITPPDKLFNNNASILMVKPTNETKQHFQKYISKVVQELNVYVYEENETDIDWLLSVHSYADITIIDIDNCDLITKNFITFMIAQPDTYYITKDEVTPYGIISKSRIYDLDSIPFFRIIENDEDDNNEQF
ncbi:MAG: hypothetical protein EBT86_07575 [Actinobacteria bacterium]|nr:hypothetical protein [Actinomycetota bacterium]